MNKKSISTLEKMRKIMRVRNYSEQTIVSYCGYVEKFLGSYNKDPYHISLLDAKNYLQDYDYSSVSQQNQIISGVKFFYREIIGSKLKTLKIIRPRKEKKLPQAIDNIELLSKIDRISNLKHKSIISLAYSTGMRVSEVINLKISNIDSSRMLILIENGKGRKDRYVPLSENILKLLRLYFKQYRPQVYLFNGQKGKMYSATSCNKIVKKYIGESYHFHQIRHSAFTTILENGTDLRIIQVIAGHSKLETTAIYTHISKQLLSNVKLPI